MPVERIDEIGLENQRVTLRNRRAFEDGKILAEVMLDADVAKRKRQISKLVAALSDEAISVLIEKRRTVEVVIVGQTAESPISVLMTTGRQRRVEGRLVRAVDRHARYAAELKVAAAERRGWRKVVKDNRRATLIPVHSTYLPATERLTADAMAQVFLPRTCREFVD